MFGLAVLIWLALIAATGIWLTAKLIHLLVKPNSIASWLSLAFPTATFALISWPVLGQSIVDEIGCRAAGLTISEPIDARSEGVYWRSHVPRVDTYSKGFSIGNDAERQILAGTLLRALVEGRIAYIEIPYKSDQGRGPQGGTKVKLFYTSASNPEAECYIGPEHRSEMGYVASQMPLNTCIAMEESDGISSRYEMGGTIPGTPRVTASNLLNFQCLTLRYPRLQPDTDCSSRPSSAFSANFV